MVEGKWFAPGAEISVPVSIRSAVFGRGEDSLDESSWNVIVWHDGAASATGRIWWQEGAYWLGDIAVLPEKRGMRLGDLTLRLLLFKAESHAASMIRLISPADTAAFFARLGFQAEKTLATGQVQMFLKGEDLCLDTCKGCKKNCPKAC